MAFLYTMEFEYDPVKSAANLCKHGIDFEAAQALWVDGDVVLLRAASGVETRTLVVGRIAGKYWTAVTTRRGQRIRIISVRRSRREEVQCHEDHQR